MTPREGAYDIGDAMHVADAALENLDGGLAPTPYQRSLISLASEVRRLREENEWLHKEIEHYQWLANHQDY